jgi:hypothetical protein
MTGELKQQGEILSLVVEYTLYGNKTNEELAEFYIYIYIYMIQTRLLWVADATGHNIYSEGTVHTFPS